MLLFEQIYGKKRQRNAVTYCVSSSYPPPPPNCLIINELVIVSLINFKKNLYELLKEVVCYILFLAAFLRLKRDFFVFTELTKL
ncbi:MAG: hypothetical protein LBB53_03945 [Prevotellaceae bacterium]|jgi:hypothetical protein|nr:hypothetical protein [Prevotellaceae bacterium]